MLCVPKLWENAGKAHRKKKDEALEELEAVDAELGISSEDGSDK